MRHRIDRTPFWPFLLVPMLGFAGVVYLASGIPGRSERMGETSSPSASAPHAGAEVARLLEALEDADAKVRLKAVEGLARVSGPSAARGLAKALADPDEAVRSAAAEAAAHMNGQALAALADALASSPSLAARAQAARLLGRTGNVEAAPRLLGLLEGLGRRPRQEEVDALRLAVVDALASMGEGVVGLLSREVIAGERGRVTEEAAAEACIRIGSPAAKPIAEGILAWKLFPDPEELRLWVSALGEIGDPGVADALECALSQDIEGMDGLVAEACRKIEAKSGVALTVRAREPGLFRGPPGAEAFGRIRDDEILITPMAPTASRIPDNGVVRLVLRGALVRTSGRNDLEVELLRRDGKWVESLRGYALRFNKRSHEGRLVKHDESDGIRLGIELIVHGDMWVKGGFAEYEVALKGAEGGLAGTYRGRFNYRPVEGGATGVSWPRPWRDPAGPALKSGERPRLLFRPHNLPMLRARARTDFGRRVLRALRARVASRKRLYCEPVNTVSTWEPGMDTAIGHAFLAVLFDDPPHGRRAAALMVDRARHPPYGGEHGERLPGPMFLFPFAYDLGCRFLEDDERQEIAAILRDYAAIITPKTGPKGVYAVTRGVFAVPGMAAIALLRDKGPFNVVEPQPPRPVFTIAPETTPGPREGVPVNPFEAGELVSQWLACGPFEGGNSGDPLASLGGAASARPQRGTAVPSGDATLRFEPLPEGVTRQVRLGPTTIEYIVLPGAEWDSRSFLYGLLEVKRERGCVVGRTRSLGALGSGMWINGRRFDQEAAILLQPGLHRLMVEVRGPVTRPTFRAIDAYFAKAEQKRYEWFREQWLAAKRRHAQTGERQEIAPVLEMSRCGTRTHLRDRVEYARRTGDFRFGGLPWPFVAACWVATGESLLPDTPFPWDAAPDPRSVSGLGNRELCFLMGLAPEKMRPPLVSEFDRRFLPDKLHTLSCMDLIGAYVNHPLEATGGRP